MSGQTLAYTVTRRAVNSKLIADEVHAFVDEVIAGTSPQWHSDTQRELVVDAIGEKLDDLNERGLITQYNVLCDQRNNNVSTMERGQFNLSIRYKQRNCLNTTRLEYVVTQQKKDKEDKDVVI